MYPEKGYCAGSNPPGGSPAAPPRNRTSAPGLVEDGAATAALLFLLFHKRLCGPLANSRFHHKPDPKLSPKSKLEVAYHKADKAIQDIVELLAAA